MGCLQACNRPDQASISLGDKLLQAINLSSKRRLRVLVEYYRSSQSIQDLDSFLLYHENTLTNPLGLCLLQGKADLFELLTESGCSVSHMEKIFEQAQVSPILCLCSNGHLPMLQVYFPHYLGRNYLLNPDRSYSLALTGNTAAVETKAFPIHEATRYGNLDIVSFLYDYFAEFLVIPIEFNINSIEEETGENCALIACREGHYNLVEYLHQNCRADFRLLNVNKENAIMVAIAGMNRSPTIAYIDIIEYLIESIKLDVTYLYEETLILAQYPDLVKYLEKKLGEAGISVSKIGIEKRLPSPNKYVVVDCVENCGQLFTTSFLTSLNEASNKSMLSTITQCPDSMNDKSFDNILYANFM